MKFRTLLSIIISTITLSATAAITEPDFAYPKTVISNALDTYATATDPVTRIHALLATTRASSDIDFDNLKLAIQLIDSTAIESTDNVEHSLLLTLEANCYQRFYQRRKYAYDNFQTPLLPYPEDISEWNGSQFKARIDSLCLLALDLSKGKEFNAPLRDFSDIITANEVGEYYIPTIRDFISLKTIDLLSDATRQSALEDIIGRTDRQSPSWYYFSCQNTDDYRNVYLQNPDNEAAGLALYLWCQNNNFDDESIEEPVNILKAAIAKYPGFIQVNELKNCLASLTRPRISLQSDNFVYPGNALKVNLSYSNASTIGLRIYNYSNPEDITKSTKPINTLSFNSINKPVKADTTICITFDKPGSYVIIPTVNGDYDIERYYSPIYCTNYLPLVVQGYEHFIGMASDAMTGKPLKGVKFTGLREENNKIITLGSTKANGMTNMSTIKAYEIFTSYGADNPKFELTNLMVSNAPYYGDDIEYNIMANIFTDRAIYHPGEVVEWSAAVAARTDELSQPAVLKGRDLTITVRNQASKVIYTESVTTDSAGQVSGKFTLPDDGLTGNYYFRASIEGSQIGYSHFMVSDYRMPTFEVNVTDVQLGDSVTIKGKARTYSDMPVTDAVVNVNITKGNSWRSTNVLSMECLTDYDGSFTITIPTDTLRTFDSKYFCASIDVTATTAETASTLKTFSIGKPYHLTCGLDMNTYEDCFAQYNVDDLIDLPVKVCDANGDAVDMDVTCNLINDQGNIAASSSSCRKINWQNIKAGKYTLQFKPSDAALCDTLAGRPSVILYSLKNNDVPDCKPLIIVSDTIYCDRTGKAEVIFGVANDDTYVYTVLTDYDEFLDVNTTTYSRGFHTLTYTLPDESLNANLQIATVRNMKVCEHELLLKNQPIRKLNIEAASFRDKLTAGDNEQWRFKLTNNDGKACPGWMIATMYNHTLDALYSVSWNKNFRFGSEWTDQTSSMVYILNDLYSTSSSSKVPLLKSTTVSLPKFKYIRNDSYFMDSFMNAGSIMVRGTQKLSAASYATADLCANLETAEMEEDAAMDEAMDEDSGEDNMVTETFDYRDSEVASAFWMPLLTSDENGNVGLTFVVPNANTTWALRAFAWSEDAAAGSLMKEIVANKPVMVQPNLPRFLRQGDTAEVQATVFNNSDIDRNINTVIEVFDIATGDILDTSTFTSDIAPMSNAIVAMNVAAPCDASAIGYRIRAISDGFSDGEQSAIPVIESSATVIDSETFYLNADDTAYTAALPDTNSATVTLQYIQNPIWSVAKAITGIRNQNTTVLDASRSLISNWAAAYISAQNPSIQAAINQWKAAPQDSALVSKLSLNGDLKLAQLDDTPWSASALSATEAMGALDQILDKATVNAAISKSLKVMSDYQNADGGWRWGKWSNRSSAWVTESILLRLAMARSMGIASNNAKVNSMISKAVSYYDSQTKRASLNMALIHAMLPDCKPSLAAEALIAEEVQYILKSYSDASVKAKAAYAIILNANGYQATAKKLTASIREFAVSQQGQGLTFPSVSRLSDYALILHAMASIDPVTSEIDAMRQWLTVQAQAIDFRDLYDADYLVTAILSSGSAWTDVPVSNCVTIDGNAIAADRTEAMSGYICHKIKSGKNVTVTPNGKTPSYGSIISIGNRPATEVKASNSKEISIDKRMVVDKKYVSQLAVGQRVKIILTVTVKRDLEYVTIIDERASALEPVDQLPGYVHSGGTSFYRENRDSSTRLYIDYLPKGTYQISYDMTANLAGTFTSGIATLQSQYAPELTAHSSGNTLTVTHK